MITVGSINIDGESIEQIREKVAKENGWPTWSRVCPPCVEIKEVEKFMDDVAESYAQSQNKHLTERCEVLINGFDVMREVASKTFDDNKELIEVVHFLYSFSKGMHFHEGSRTDKEISSLLAKYGKNTFK